MRLRIRSARSRVLVTDGRVSFQHDGISIAHVVPEAFDGGGLAAIRTGDWIYLDLSQGEFQVVTHANRGYKVLGAKELANRPDRKKRINELERRRLDLLPSFRILLDQVSSAESGVSPVIKSLGSLLSHESPRSRYLLQFFLMAYELVLFKNINDPRAKEIDRYIELGGYKAAEKVVKELTPKDVIETTKATGLRGRGGAGFPTGMKWSFVPKDTGKPIYLCCNADESEPGTCKDRVIMERDPHQLIEGMIIAAYAVDCHLAFIYIRGEFSLGYRVLEKALEEARARGFLGKKIFGSNYDLDIVLHSGAGAYICGEETGLDRIAGRKARTSAAEAAVSGGSGTLQLPDGCEQCRNACESAAHFQSRRRLVQEHRFEREEHRSQALLRQRACQ